MTTMQRTTSAVDQLRTSAPSSTPPNHPKPVGKGWSRDQVTVKLTPRRKSLLCDIALGMPNGTTPSDAIERALEDAWAANHELAGLASRIESLEDTVQAANEERRREAIENMEALAALTANLSMLLKLIQEMA